MLGLFKWDEKKHIKDAQKNGQPKPTPPEWKDVEELQPSWLGIKTAFQTHAPAIALGMTTPFLQVQKMFADAQKNRTPSQRKRLAPSQPASDSTPLKPLLPLCPTNRATKNDKQW